MILSIMLNKKALIVTNHKYYIHIGISGSNHDAFSKIIIICVILINKIENMRNKVNTN